MKRTYITPEISAYNVDNVIMVDPSKPGAGGEGNPGDEGQSKNNFINAFSLDSDND